MSKSESSFTEKGFNNWKDGSSEHSLSSAHRATAEYMASEHKASVAVQVCTQFSKEQERNRKRLPVVVKVNSIIFLMRQGLALKEGKDEANDNLHQVLQTASPEWCC